jgi:hypothetical protein
MASDGKLKSFQVKLSASSRGKLEALIDSGISTRNQDNTFGKVMMSLLPVLLLIVLIFFLFRHQMKSAGRGAMSFGKSKAKLLTMDQQKVTFKDVAGIQEAKEELFEIVDFLREESRVLDAREETITKNRAAKRKTVGFHGIFAFVRIAPHGLGGRSRDEARRSARGRGPGSFGSCQRRG